MAPSTIQTENAFWFVAKNFLAFSGFFVLLSVPLEYFTRGSVGAMITMGIWYGALMAVGSCGFHVASAHKTLRGRSIGAARTTSVAQSRVATVLGQVDGVTSAARAALKHLLAHNVQLVSEGQVRISATIPASVRTWGDSITVSIEPAHAGACDVRVESHPRVRGTMCDYGKNLDNLDRFFDAMEKAGALTEDRPPIMPTLSPDEVTRRLSRWLEK